MKNNMIGLIKGIYKLVILFVVPFIIIGMVNYNVTIANGITALILLVLMFNVDKFFNKLGIKFEED